MDGWKVPIDDALKWILPDECECDDGEAVSSPPAADAPRPPSHPTLRKRRGSAAPVSTSPIDPTLASKPTTQGALAYACILACAIALRLALMMQPYSGAAKPPMYGDFEAQRHWMEVTLHLPIGEWYTHTARNDLLYWGLDYPPITAYVSWLFGALADCLVPDLVAWESSRGHESVDGKLFMRLSVLLCDVLIWLPSVLWLSRALCSTVCARVRCVATLMFVPALLLIDHGHFQYNQFSLGLSLAAVAAFTDGRWLACAALFALALNFKQMTLYYSTAFFAALLAVAARGGVLRVGAAPVVRVVANVACIGAVVAAVFVCVWMPFCAAPAPHDTCSASLLAVLKRQFPFNRSLFEDKVSNWWCAMEPVLRLRQRVSVDTSGALQRVAALAAAAVTLAACLPSCILLFLFVFREQSAGSAARGGWSRGEYMLLALFGCAMAFFLGSYQVHEKSILIPLLPLTALAHRLPLFVAWMTALSTISMWPLLQRDGLLTAGLALVVLYCLCWWPTHSHSPGAAAPSSKAWMAPSRLQLLASASVLSVVLVCVLSLFVSPPARLPDLWPYLSATLCALYFTVALVIGWLVMWERLST